MLLLKKLDENKIEDMAIYDKSLKALQKFYFHLVSSTRLITLILVSIRRSK